MRKMKERKEGRKNKEEAEEKKVCNHLFFNSVFVRLTCLSESF